MSAWQVHGVHEQRRALKELISRFLIMKNQPIFARILEPERVDCLDSEITLGSVSIVIERNDVGYYVFDDIIYYIDDGWGIMLAQLWCEL